MFAACLLSFGAGFLSLSLEILWIRLFSFANYSLPQAFAFVLIFYLIGIACGAGVGKRLCEDNYNLWKISGIVLLFSSLSDLLSPWLYAFNVYLNFPFMCGAALILLTAALKAIIFPIAHHIGTPSFGSQVGRSLSRVYVSNILGATLGPLLTGMVALSVFSTQQCFIICAALTFLLSLYCFSAILKPVLLSVSGIVFLWLVTMMMIILNPHQLIANIAGQEGYLRRIVENQYGIITTYYGGQGGDVIAGGNVYDGRTNLDPVINSNHINRLLILPALKTNPEHVLIIGLSIGTWLKLVTSFPNVKTIDVVEINPGYLRAMQDYPRQWSALSDARVRLYMDDGRRWLKAHPDNQYDLVIMNTTYYWRAYTSHLLSREFLQLVKHHLRPEGILTYNTTSSPDVLKTAADVFPHVYLYENFAVASDMDWRKKLQDPKAVKLLSALYLDGKPLFPPHSEKLIQSFLALPLISLPQLEDYYAARGRELEVITDQNLITEYRYGKWLSATNPMN